MHYYQKNIADYRKDTCHLTLLEHGVYGQLLDQYYLSEEPITLDESKLFRLMRAITNEEQNAIKLVLSDFFTKTGDGYVHKRCQNEIEIYHSRIETATRSAKIRWDKEKNANAMPTHSEPNTNHKPITTNHKPITNNILTIVNKAYTDFEEFWKLYPKKVGKEAARKSWEKVNPPLEKVMQSLQWQKESSQWFKNNGDFIPNPATYINQHRFEDEPPKDITF
tara:strand:+ start:414 stop:1079 length:666 start_codon:yes stop_codon:yes gene_type:complete